ncbi:MAG TPA: TIGR04438 family Trp-rich protein [Methylibium sp.]
MWFVVIGVLLLVMKVADFGPVGGWSWLLVLAPFACAVAWWAWADASGYTKRREMDKVDAVREERRKRNLASLGLPTRRKRR